MGLESQPFRVFHFWPLFSDLHQCVQILDLHWELDLLKLLRVSSDHCGATLSSSESYPCVCWASSAARGCCGSTSCVTSGLLLVRVISGTFCTSLSSCWGLLSSALRACDSDTARLTLTLEPQAAVRTFLHCRRHLVCWLFIHVRCIDP